jgi:hypothetical protein
MDLFWMDLRQLSAASDYVEVLTADIPARVGRLCEQAPQLTDTYWLYLPGHVYKYLQAAAVTEWTVPFCTCCKICTKLPEVTREHLHLFKGRPIAACHSWVTNGASVYLADVLNDTCWRLYPQVLPDSRTLVRELYDSKVSCDAFLATFDMESMYPSIDYARAVPACAHAAAQCGYHGGMVEASLSFVMQHGYRQFDGWYYR